jgi:hypothetical protein
MCAPQLMLAATVMQAAGSIRQGNAAARQYSDAAAQDDYQAGIERSNASAEAARIRVAGERQHGATLAGVAASGIKIGEGSALDAERQVMQDASRDEYMTLLTGARRSDAFLREAAMKRAAARDARRAGNVSTFTSLLGSGGNFLKASGWGLNGPGFSGSQMPAPVETRSFTR